MNYIIIEDERHNRKMLEAYISELRPQWEMVTYFEKVGKAVEYFKNNKTPDLIFCDIQLKDGISFEIFSQAEINCPIIFTTAFDEYAIRAFEVKSVDYLLKPIEENKLLKAIVKYEEFSKTISSSSFSSTETQELLRNITQKKTSFRKRFLISGIDAYYKVDASEIAYFVSEAGITSAVLFNGKEHIVDFTLEKLEIQMDPEEFTRANRSYILNINSVLKFENHFGGKLAVHVKPNRSECIIVSRLKATAFKQWFDQ